MDTENTEKQWYTTAEACEFLGVDVYRLGRLRREGRIEGIVGGGKNPRYSMYHISQLKAVDTSDQRKKNVAKPGNEDEEGESNRVSKSVLFKDSDGWYNRSSDMTAIAELAVC